MKDTLQKRPFVVGTDSFTKLERIHLTEAAFQEEWLQRLLQNAPQLLPVAEIDAIYAPLVCIGREVATPVGPVDNLYVSPKGYITIVETKLWRNPQARREVVGQIIDYAKEVARFSYEELDKRVRDYNRTYNGKDLNLFATMVERGLLTADEETLFTDLVEKNLNHARFLLLIVGDGIRDSVWRMTEFLNTTPNMLYNLALVELEVYRLADDERLVVPNLLMTTRTVERGVFRIEQGAVIPMPVVEEPEDAGQRRPFNRDDFVALLSNENPQISEEDMTKFLDDLQDLGFLVTRYGKADLKIMYPMPGGKSYLYVIYFSTVKGGIAYKNTGTLERDLEAAGYSGEIARAFYQDLRPYQIDHLGSVKRVYHQIESMLQNETQVIATFDRLRSNF
jgi:hypothetical protein